MNGQISYTWNQEQFPEYLGLALRFGPLRAGKMVVHCPSGVVVQRRDVSLQR